MPEKGQKDDGLAKQRLQTGLSKYAQRAKQRQKYLGLSKIADQFF